MNTINEIIKKTAEKYVGKSEKPNNSGFLDAEFEQKMKSVGWEKSQAWCSYFAELVWRESYSDTSLPKAFAEKCLAEIKQLCSGSATGTYKNFDLSDWSTRKPLPEVGSIVIWRFGNGWQGHAAIVIAVSEATNTITTIEGNTNSSGGREGVEVAIKQRKIKAKYNANGLNLVGFIQPKKVQ